MANSLGGNTLSALNPLTKIDWLAFKRRILSITLNPIACWEDLKSESRSLKELCTQDAVIFALVLPVSQFIHRVIMNSGVLRWRFFDGLGMAIVEFGMIYSGIMVLAIILQQLAKRFSGSLDNLTATKLAIYPLIPSLLGGVFGLIPTLSILSLVLSCYSLYLLWLAIPVMSGVPSTKRMKFFGLSLGIEILSMIIISLFVRILIF